jgi:hypothetical protein
VNLTEVDNACAVITPRGVLAVSPHPDDPLQRPLIPLYLSYGYAQKVAARASKRHGGDVTVSYIAEINALREFVKALGDDCIVMVIAGESEITDQVERTPRDLLAELPTGDQYGFAYESKDFERFDPGDTNITPGVHKAFGPKVGEILQKLLERHLSGDYGAVPKEPEEGSKSEWQQNDENIQASSEPYVMSVYKDIEGVTIWIISQYGNTYMMLPSEH